MAKITPRLTLLSGTTELDVENISYDSEVSYNGITGSCKILDTSLTIAKGDTLDLKLIEDTSETYIAPVVVTGIEELENDHSLKTYSIEFQDTLSYELEEEKTISFFDINGNYFVTEVANKIDSYLSYSIDESYINDHDEVTGFREFQSNGALKDAVQLFERVFGCLFKVDYESKTLTAAMDWGSFGTVTPITKRTKTLAGVSGVYLGGTLNYKQTTSGSKDYAVNLETNKWAVHVEVAGSNLIGYTRADIKHRDISNTDGVSGITDATIDGSSVTNIMTSDEFEALDDDSLPEEDFIVVVDEHNISLHRYIDIDISGVSNTEKSHLAMKAKKESECVFKFTASGPTAYEWTYEYWYGDSPYHVVHSDDPYTESAAQRVVELLYKKLSRSDEVVTDIMEDNVVHAGQYVTMNGEQYFVANVSAEGNPVQLSLTLRK